MRTKKQRINDLADEMEGQEWTFGQILEHINRGLSQRQHIERRQLRKLPRQTQEVQRCRPTTHQGPSTS